jgi:ribosomal protein S18 acetylase RimI-like enzyme
MGMSTTIAGTEVGTAGPGEQDRIVDSLVLAFAQDPVTRWVYPRPHQYLMAFGEFVLAFGEKAFSHESAHYAGEFLGAALWIPPGEEPDEEPLVEQIERNVDPHKLGTVFGIFEEMGRHHPDEPLWYLALIGVDAAHQRRGIGATLLRHGLERVDEDGCAAYLESSNPENIPLYERHGFQVVGTIQVGDAPVITPMLRRPGARGG